MKDWVKKNWKSIAIALAAGAAGAYGGAPAADAVRQYLPVIYGALVGG